ncbi:MAG: D-amino acid dehydrogenase [Hyphomicrobiales bacterium]|nr:D-amino acid dehydrogenase [Hyphomicrobiales bacterium]MDE2016317.1 D-amino acid dehydrogenase [Hyphomicrobiales bacterium]
MKIAVLGAGVIGVTTAWELVADGHEVVVLDRQPGPAMETSNANAGEISPGYASPWAGPGVPTKALHWLAMEHTPLILRPRPSLAMALFLARMLRNCTAARYVANKSRMSRVADYSRERLIALRAATGIEYDHRERGTLQLFREARQVEAADKDVAVLKARGTRFETLDVAGCIAAEPALANVREKFVGGLRLPDDETGDCKMFTERLAELARARGATFRHGVAISGLAQSGGRIEGVATSEGMVEADAYVVALAAHSPALLRPLGLDVPIYPVKGYSITAALRDPARAPESTVMDESHKVAITRLGDRIRVGGMAEISGFSTDLPPKRRATLEHVVSDLFPGGGDYAGATYWTGLRPMTPDGTPVIGRGRQANLYVNAGHGTLGWTMACGSARIVADLVSGRRPDVDVADLGWERYA